MGAPPLGLVPRLTAHLPAALVDRLPATWRPPLPSAAHPPRVAIVGTGFGGLGMACRLRQAGIESFTIYEKADGVGGTWRDNTYPGAACDVPSHLYSLSFAPKTDWTRRFPSQPEILAYLEGLVDEFDLGPHLLLGTEVRDATWDDAAQRWRLTLADGSVDEAEVLVAATGQLSRPVIPAIEGLEDFEGPAFHSARWDHDADLTGDVAVVGIGASAIQFVPQLAKRARSVTLYQRSVNYVGPKPDGEFSPRTRRLFERVPLARRLYRAYLWARFDLRWIVLRKGSRLGELARGRFEAQLRPLATDDLPVEAVVPDYALGCKRILIANDWYPTILSPHVHVVTDRVERTTPTGVVAGGTERRADALVFGTGFASTEFLTPMAVHGRDGRELSEVWRAGAEAHLGMTVAGFPNLFVLYGPNTNLGHNSIVFMLERQITYVLDLVRELATAPTAAVEVRADVQAASNRRLQAELDQTVWATDCHSWYKTDDGRITNNWSGPTIRYWWRTLRPRHDEFVRSRRRPAPVAPTPAAVHSGHAAEAG